MLDRHASIRAQPVIAVGPIGEHQRSVEHHAEDEADRQVAGQERGHHADRQHRQADDPVADVVRRETANKSGLPSTRSISKLQISENNQRDGEDATAGQVLAQHHVEIAGRNRQQQFVGPLPPLVGPDAHRDGRDEHQQDVGQVVIQLVEVVPGWR